MCTKQMAYEGTECRFESRLHLFNAKKTNFENGCSPSYPILNIFLKFFTKLDTSRVVLTEMKLSIHSKTERDPKITEVTYYGHSWSVVNYPWAQLWNLTSYLSSPNYQKQAANS